MFLTVHLIADHPSINLLSISIFSSLDTDMSDMSCLYLIIALNNIQGLYYEEYELIYNFDLFSLS